MTKIRGEVKLSAPSDLALTARPPPPAPRWRANKGELSSTALAGEVPKRSEGGGGLYLICAVSQKAKSTTP